MFFCFFFLRMDIQLLQYHLLNKLYFLLTAFVSLSRIRWVYLYGFISGFLFNQSIHLSIWLSIHQYHTVLITVVMVSLNTRLNDLSQFILIFPKLFG